MRASFLRRCQPIQPIHLKMWPNWPNQQCCLAGSSKTAPRIFNFFNCNGCRSFILCENHWDPCVRIFPLNISTIGTVLDLVYLHTSHWRVIIPKSLCPSHKCLQIFFKILGDSCQILYCKKGNNKWASQGFFFTIFTYGRKVQVHLMDLSKYKTLCQFVESWLNLCRGKNPNVNYSKKQKKRHTLPMVKKHFFQLTF